MNHTARCCFVFLLASSLHAQEAARGPASPVSASISSESVKGGERLYLQRCALCHSGTAPRYETYGPLLNGQLIASRGDERARKFIVDGSARMPGFQYSLDDAQITNIIAFLKTLKDSNWR